jgi:hypothetical protein
MRNPVPAALCAGLLTAATACGSPAPAPAVPPPPAYQKAITSMTAHCTQDASQLQAMVASVRSIEVKAGITDESLTALAGHLATIVAAYKTPVSCTDPFAAYATMRTGGS